MHFLVTGHTGFKGAWLTLLLDRLGHEVSGLSLDPDKGGLFDRGDVGAVMRHDGRGDIRDPAVVTGTLEITTPDVVIHMAAQPLVRDSYRAPRWTFETNAIGTLNVLECVGTTPSVHALVVVTTDKVYRNDGRTTGYCEDDALGGRDPYSASKTMADVLTYAWAQSFGGPPTAIARAGNVIGGGDVSHERLLPDIMRALTEGSAPEIRNPTAVRPWQHVLDCLSGYYALAQRLVAAAGASEPGRAWNFGPPQQSVATVGHVATLVCEAWAGGVSWGPKSDAAFHEEHLLTLNAAQAEKDLGWSNTLSLEEAVTWTVEWSRDVVAGASARDCTVRQIERFLAKSDSIALAR
jgi:CDP-glucose 4,6-dehydratase